MQKVSSFGERLKEFMATNDHMTYEQLSTATGYPAQTLNRYVLGQRIPKINDFAQIAERLNVNPLWLQGFDVEKEPVAMNDNELGNLTREEADFINIFRKLSPEKQRELIDFAQYKADK